MVRGKRKQYKHEVLERRVSIQFYVKEGSKKTTAFYGGRVKKCELEIKRGKLRSRHWVAFDDGESKWIDLGYMESIDSLKWLSSKNTGKKQREKRGGTKRQMLSATTTMQGRDDEQYTDKKTAAQDINTSLHKSVRKRINHVNETREHKEKVLKIGDIVLAKWHVDKNFYWGRIVRVNKISRTGMRYHIRFHDGDESSSVLADDLSRGVCYLPLIHAGYWNENLPPKEYMEELGGLKDQQPRIMPKEEDHDDSSDSDSTEDLLSDNETGACDSSSRDPTHGSPPTQTSAQEKSRNAVMNEKSFPKRLWKTLELSEHDPSWKKIISWMDNGTAFVVHNRKDFEKNFATSTFTNFVSNLKCYGFQRVGKGEHFHHQRFTRSDKKQSEEIPCLNAYVSWSSPKATTTSEQVKTAALGQRSSKPAARRPSVQAGSDETVSEYASAPVTSNLARAKKRPPPPPLSQKRPRLNDELAAPMGNANAPAHNPSVAAAAEADEVLVIDDDYSTEGVDPPRGKFVDAVVTTSISRAPPVAAATGAYDREESESDDDDEYAIEI